MPLRHPHVRHLFWSICSQELAVIPDIPALEEIDVQAVFSWCQALDNNPTVLKTFIEEREHRLLGSYFEVLWQFFLSHYPSWTLLGSGIQIPPSGPTLGELDILCSTPEGHPLHVELAVKFYLQHPDHDGSQAEHWLGPKTIDRLDLKLEKLAKKQFTMLNHPTTQQTLSELHLPTEAKPASVIKGYLFRPYGRNNQTDLPPVCPYNHTHGEWIHADRVQEILNLHDHWQYIAKWQWLGDYQQTEDPLSPQSLLDYCQQHFARPNYALMLIALKTDDTQWVEHKRYMVVNNNWPLSD